MTSTKRATRPSDATSRLEEMAAEIFDLTLLGWMTQGDNQPRGYDLSESEFMALELLSRAEPQSVGELQKGIGVLPAQMSRVIRSLEEKHDKPLITCSINPADKRKIDVARTDEGRKAHQAYRSSKMIGTVDVLAQLDEADREGFMRVIRRIRELIAARGPEGGR